FPYPVSISGKRASDHIITLNWALKDRPDIEDTLVYMILDFILVRMSSSPLRNKLINANIGKHLAGQGLYADLQQPCFSIGLKGVSSKNVNMVETYIMQTLNALVKEGIDPRIIQAALNRTEFSLYEGNFGKIPPGIQYMLRAMSGWLYNSDPLNRITFEATLKALKTKIKNNSCFFEDLIENYFLKNKHRATIILYPDATLLKREENEERKRLHAVRTCMSDTELNNIITMSEKLSLLHKSPDSKEARSTLPEIKLSKEILDDDFPVVIPYKLKEMQLLYNNLPGRGIVYITLGFDIHTLPLEYLPFARLYTRALLQMGTKKYRYVELNQLINQNTGGIHTGFLNIIKRGSEESVTRIFLKSRTLINRVEALTGILKEVLVFSQLDNLERFKQLVREEIARHESMLVTEEVHKILRYRLQAHFNEAGWVCEHISGINYISFLRRLLADIENNWDYVLNVLRNMHSILCNRNTMIINIMADKSSQSKINKCLERIIESIPARQKSSISWKYDSLIESEGFAIPTTLGMVAKGVNITHLDETIYGTGLVVNQYLKTSWFWNKIRIQGGAYGLYSSFDRLSGIFSVISYRDPDIVRTLGLFNKSACVLDDIKLNKDELKRYIIGALREFHPYRAPDATGHLAVAYFLAGVNITELQNIRNKILDTTFKDIYRLSDLLRSFADSKIVKIIASDTIINTVKESCLQDLVLYNII
ncbi:MAG: insulinase family protein, partial [candidate division Zixibacteria bacterium]|nr:insulinase family protein [candidate division Zixibacteria bacterium]